MTHFTNFELQRWRDAGPGADRERIVAHVAECASCAASYAEAIRTRPLESGLPADTRDFVAAGYAARRPYVSPWRWAVPLAVAAVLVIAMVAPRWSPRNQDSSTMTFRGGSIHALAPEGAVDPATLVFTWSSAVSAGRFKLQVGDSGGVIYSVEAAQSRLDAPQALKQLLRPGDYWWSVAALDADGKVLVESERRSFSVKTAP